MHICHIIKIATLCSSHFICVCVETAYIWAFSQPLSWLNLLLIVHMQWLPPLFQMHQIPVSSLKTRRQTQNCYSPSCFPPTNWPRASVPRTTTVLAPGLCTQAPGHAGSCLRRFVKNNTQNVSTILCLQWGSRVSSLMSCGTGWLVMTTDMAKALMLCPYTQKQSVCQSACRGLRAVTSSQLHC